MTTDKINIPTSKDIEKDLDLTNSMNTKGNNEVQKNNELYNLKNIKQTISDPISSQNTNLYDEKIKALEKEIEFLKSEKDSVAGIKQEYQLLFMELNKEVDNFYFKKESETKEFEKWKEEEIKKIQKDKKANELKSGRSNHNIIPSKKDKEEIESLKNIIAKMQEEFKIKDNNNKLTIEKLKRKLEESNNKIAELNKTVEELSNKSVLMRSNSTGLINRINNSNNTNTVANSKNNNNINPINKRIINYNEANNINNINNHSTNFSPSTQGILSKNSEERNYHKVNKSMYLQINNLSTNNLANILSNNNINKSKQNSKEFSEDLSKMNTMQPPKLDSEDIKGKNTNKNKLNNIQNKSIEISKKITAEFDKADNNIITTGNIDSEANVMIENEYDDGVYDLIFLEKYHPRNDLKINVEKLENFPDGKIVKFYENSKREVIFPSGVRKEIFPDGYQIVYFNNKDVKQVNLFYFKISYFLKRYENVIYLIGYYLGLS